MSVVQACAQAEAVIERARSLFAAAPEPVAADGAAAVADAAQSTAATGQPTAESSGALIAEHESFAARSAAALTAAGRTEAALTAHVATAASLTQVGADQLSAIAAETQEVSRAAAMVSTPAGERAVLIALRSQLARATEIVSSARQQAAGLAGRVRALHYPADVGRPSGAGDRHALVGGLPGRRLAPEGPIVWCLRPGTTAGLFRCSVLYPDLSVGVYWSPTDDSGGSVP